MNIILWCVTGAGIALLASFRTTTLCRQRLLIDVAFSVLGAVVGGMLAVPAAQWLSFDTHWEGLAAAIIGAVTLLSIAHLRALRQPQP